MKDQKIYTIQDIVKELSEEIHYSEKTIMFVYEHFCNKINNFFRSLEVKIEIPYLGYYIIKKNGVFTSQRYKKYADKNKQKEIVDHLYSRRRVKRPRKINEKNRELFKYRHVQNTHAEDGTEFHFTLKR